jgi:hypothetical protein
MIGLYSGEFVLVMIPHQANVFLQLSNLFLHFCLLLLHLLHVPVGQVLVVVFADDQCLQKVDFTAQILDLTAPFAVALTVIADGLLEAGNAFIELFHQSGMPGSALLIFLQLPGQDVVLHLQGLDIG